MTSDQKQLLGINIVGGLAVLGSYALGIALHPGEGEALWGRLDDRFRDVYTVSMVAAAAGYFGFAPYLLFRVEPARFVFAGGLRYPTLRWIFLLVLIPSAAWMPLTFVYLQDPSTALWLLIRAVLVLVGLGSLSLIGALLTTTPAARRRGHTIAVIGSLLFTWQTAVLDALIWPIQFR